MNPDILNAKYNDLHPKQRLEKVFEHFDEDKILVTSSFGSTSVVLLHLLSEVCPGHPVHFINTTYLFEETLAYRDQLMRQLNLNLIEIKAEEKKNNFTRENKSWIHNQDLCCFINKVNPVDQIKNNYEVWISGLLAFQNENRRNLKLFDRKDNVLKFHPIIDLTKEDVALYMKLYDLPLHQLVPQGYDSIGCTHCTVKGNGRNGRWADLTKAECGLHA